MKPRRALTWAALLLVTSGSLVVAPAKQPVLPANAPELAIYLEFEHQPSEAAIDEMKREVGSILEPVGLQLQWRLLTDDYYSENFDELAVMRFTGECHADPFPMIRIREAALGEAVVSDGQVLPFGAVECNHVRRLVFDQIRGDRGSELLLGRALGRVLAHELYHILARTTRHAASGIAKPFYTPEDLVQRKLAFGRNELDRLRRALPPTRHIVQMPATVPDGPIQSFTVPTGAN